MKIDIKRKVTKTKSTQQWKTISQNLTDFRKQDWHYRHNILNSLWLSPGIQFCNIINPLQSTSIKFIIRMLFSPSQTFHVTSSSVRWKAFVTENSLKESKKSKSGKQIHIFLEMGSIHKAFSKFKVNLLSFCVLFITGIWQLSGSQSSSWTEYIGPSSLNKN